MSMQPAVQPPLIAGPINAILVFCGLIVAGVLTLLASSAAMALPRWVVYAGLAAVLSALGGGLAALIAMLHAVNLSRRVEKASNPVKAAEQTGIDAARKLSTQSSELSFWICAIASVCAAVLLGGFVISVPAKADATGQQLVLRTQSAVVELTGDLKRVRIDDAAGHCVLDLEGGVAPKTGLPKC